MEHRIKVHISLQKIVHWILCRKGLLRYAPNEKEPLIDIVQDESGNKIYIFIYDEKGGETVEGKNRGDHRESGEWNPLSENRKMSG